MCCISSNPLQNQKLPLILASESPRRYDLLKQIGLYFDVVPSRIDESKIPVSSPEIYARVLAEAKAKKVSDRFPNPWVIAADTVVVINKTILGKPHSISDARNMLKRLNGKIHDVFTGFTVCSKAMNRFFSETVKTEVHFKNLTDQEIEWYIQTQEPLDKAGAYAIQGIGSFMVRGINGSYTNVVGLPVCELVTHLNNVGIMKLTI